MNWLDIMLRFAPAVAALAAAVGLILNAFATWSSAKVRRQETFTHFVVDLREMEAQFYREYDGKDEATRRKWDSLFLNSLEYMSFLVNHGYVRDRKMVQFFAPAFVGWHQDILQAHVENWRDPNMYEEFKKLCGKLNPEIRAAQKTKSA